MTSGFFHFISMLTRTQTEQEKIISFRKVIQFAPNPLVFTDYIYRLVECIKSQPIIDKRTFTSGNITSLYKNICSQSNVEALRDHSHAVKANILAIVAILGSLFPPCSQTNLQSLLSTREKNYIKSLQQRYAKIYQPNQLPLQPFKELPPSTFDSSPVILSVSSSPSTSPFEAQDNSQDSFSSNYSSQNQDTFIVDQFSSFDLIDQFSSFDFLANDDQEFL